jgi:hypothetical protein
MNWPTATVTSGAQTADAPTPRQTGGTTLAGAVQKNWLTPRANEPEEDALAFSLRNGDRGLHCHGSLSSQVKDWPTAASRDYKGESGTGRQERKGHPADTLPNAVAQWPTPTAAEGSKIGSQANYGQLGLSNHPAIVGEPTRPKGQKSRSGPPPTASGPLGPDSRSTDGSRQESWPSPRASDGSKATRTPEEAAQEVSRNKGPDLGAVVVANQARAESWATPTTDNANNATRESGAFQSLTRQAGKLNPSWVETLMGLPIGWTQLPHKFTKPKKGTP